MKTRSYLLIAATLIIGIIIGFLGNGYLTRLKFQKFVHQSGEQIFKKRMMEVLQPTDSQFEKIEPILDKYDRIAHQNFQESRSRMQALHEEMSRELAQYLDENQREALRNWDQRHREMRQPSGKPHRHDKPKRKPPKE